MSHQIVHPTGEVLLAHEGSSGLRDAVVLKSTIAAPQSTTMMGQPLFDEPIEVAAAYRFYLCRNHHFLDGNNRTALATSLVFLSENGLLPDENLNVDTWEALTLCVTSSKFDIDLTTNELQKLL